MLTRIQLILAAAAILLQPSQSANILVPTLTHGSVWMSVAKIAEALACRGHNITVVAPAHEKSDLLRKLPTFRYETFGGLEKPPLMKKAGKTVPQNMTFSSFGLGGFLTWYRFLAADLLDNCEGMLSDKRLLTTLMNSTYDVVLTYPGPSCGFFMAQYLDLPLVCTLRAIPIGPTGLDIRATGVPNPLSYIPTVMSELSDRMTFFQRVKNVLVYVALTTVGRLVEKRFDDIASRTIGDSFTTFSALARTDVWLYQTDVMFDFPKPIMPNMVSIAGHMAHDVKPLSEALEKFVQSSGDEGVVVVTFGSMIATMPAGIANMLAAALARLPQKVVWRYAGEQPSNLGPNTRTMEWVPQNDLLAHSKVKGFVSHGGYNGVAEAMYHGVPLVGMPLFTDQPDNIARMVARGTAVSLDIHSATSDEIYQAITTVVSDPRYKEIAKRMSLLLRDQPEPPLERAVWWIEHVIRHRGLPHLRSTSTELPFYKYYMIDVLALIVVVMASILWPCWKCCFLACGMCKRGTTSTRQKSD